MTLNLQQLISFSIEVIAYDFYQKPIESDMLHFVVDCTSIVSALARCYNRISQTARLLRVSRPTLYNLMDKNELMVETKHG